MLDGFALCPKMFPEAVDIDDVVIQNRGVYVGTGETTTVFGMLPARRFDLQNSGSGSFGESCLQELTEHPDLFERRSLRGPDVDFPRALAFVSQVHAPIEPNWEARCRDDSFIAVVHPMRSQASCDSRAQFEELAHIESQWNHVDVKISPCHQTQRVASDDVDIAIVLESLPQPRSEELIRLNPKFRLEVCRHCFEP